MTKKRATYPHYNFKTNTQFLVDNGKIKYSKHQIYSKDIKFYSVQFWTAPCPFNRKIGKLVKCYLIFKGIMIELIGFQIKSFRSTCNKTLNDQLKNEKNETFLLVNFILSFFYFPEGRSKICFIINKHTRKPKEFSLGSPYIWLSLNI